MNFGDLPSEYCKEKNSSIVILPVPYDGTSTWIKGADKGPDAIIDSSVHMELYDIETNSEVYKNGIYTSKSLTRFSSVNTMVKAVKAKTLDLINQNKFQVTIGGEHSVTIGVVEALAEKYKEVTVLQLDAHSDMREDYDGSKYNHACAMARAKDHFPVVQVGIRSVDSSELKNIKKENLFLASEIQKDKTWKDKVVNRLSKKVYLTIDLDVFDPSIIPSTGTPEPGGLGWYEVIDLIEKVIKEKELIGFDVVELCPNPNDQAPDFLAAKLIYKILSYKFSGGKNG